MDLLLELYGEDVPPRYQQSAVGDLAAAFRERLVKTGIQKDTFDIRCYHSPRRLALWFSGLAEKMPEIREIKRGPLQQSPAHVVDAFARRYGVSVAQCLTVKHRDRDYYAVEIVSGNEDLQEIILPWLQDIIRRFRWPKAMRFGHQSLPWIRPLHQVMILCGRTTISGSLIMERTSAKDDNNDTAPISDNMTVPLLPTTIGHSRFYPAEIKIDEPANYCEALAKNGVIVDPSDRRGLLLECLKVHAGEAYHKIPAAWIEELSDMAEWPYPIVLDLPQDYDDLPTNVVEAVLWQQQKIIVFEQEAGKRAYLFVLDRPVDDGVEAIKASLNRVVRARLDDALALLDEDRHRFAKILGVALTDMKAGNQQLLDGIKQDGDDTLQHAQRCLRVAKQAMLDLSISVSQETHAAMDQVILLRCALVKASMIEEYPELEAQFVHMLTRQRLQNFPQIQTILHHLDESDNELPTKTNISDKRLASFIRFSFTLEALTRLISRYGVPTGSEDPYALRGRAQEILATLAEVAKSQRFDLAQILQHALPRDAAESLVADVQTYLLNRLGALYEGLEAHMLPGVRASCHDRMADLMVIIPAMADWAQENRADFQTLIQVARRTTNILRKSEPEMTDNDVVESQLIEPSERALWQAINSLKVLRDKDKKVLVDREIRLQETREQFTNVANLALPLDLFFNEVHVNTDDYTLRSNRRNLLRALQHFLDQFADFTLITNNWQE